MKYISNVDVNLVSGGGRHSQCVCQIDGRSELRGGVSNKATCVLLCCYEYNALEYGYQKKPGSALKTGKCVR